MIATSIPQSKRLLEAGLDKEMADMCWRNYVLTYDFGHAMEVGAVEPILYAFNTKSRDSTPAWSLAALWDIVHSLDKTYDFDTKMSSEELIEILVKTIEYRFKNRTSG